MRYLFLLLFLCALRVSAAIGDATGWEIETNGTRILPHISGLNTNGMFYPGFGTNNSISRTQMLTISVVSTGYSTAGVQGLVTNTYYGTKLERLVYPNDGTNRVDTEGDGCVPHIWLSYQIYTNDVVTVSTRDGYYAVTNGTGTNATAVTAMAVTNLSTQPYDQIAANWSPRTPRYQRVTNSVRMSVVAFQGNGRNRKPVQAVRVIGTGLTSGVKTSNTVSSMTVDTAWWKLSPYWNVYTNIGNVQAGEFNVDLDLSGMTPLEEVRFDMRIFPRLGDTPLDTSSDTYPIWDPRPTHIRNTYDPSNHYSKVVAIVHDTLGTNASGRVATNGDWTTIAETNYYNTISAAMNAAAATNNVVFGHNDTGGAIIYVLSTNYPGGSGITATTVPKVAPIITPIPGSNAVALTHTTGGSSSGLKRLRIIGWPMTVAAGSPFSAIDYFSIEDTSCVSTSTLPFSTCTNLNFLRTTLGSFAADLSAVPTRDSGVSMQGVLLNGFNRNTFARTWVGVVHPDTNSGPNFTVSTHAGALNPTGYEIIYNCYLDGGTSSSAMLNLANNNIISLPQAVVQCFFGKCTPNQAVAAIASASVVTNATNIILWACLFDGARIADYASSGTETNVITRKSFHAVGNVWAFPGQKGDKEAGTESENRYGGWDQLNMVNGRGNFYARNAVFPVTVSFRPEFAGVNTYEPAVTNVANYARYRQRLTAVVGQANTTGGGGGWIYTDSPLLHPSLYHDSPLPFDLIGCARGEFSPPGPYAEGDPRR